MSHCAAAPALIALEAIHKSFPGVKSLDAVSFEARSGEVHALLGENGAGKSTLIKIIAGAYAPDAGTIIYDGKSRVWSSPKAAQEAGIHVIYQELMLFPALSVAENIFAGANLRNRFGLVDRRAMYEQAAASLERLGHRLDPRARLGALSLADQQMVEIAKALNKNARLLVLDEPTAVISGRETELLLERVRTLAAAGVCVIYISHRLEEIFEVCDRVTVLKDGRHVATQAVADVDRPTLVSQMVGRKLADIFPVKLEAVPKGEPVLSVRNLRSEPRVRDVSFDLWPGEILGLAGLVGSGRSEAAHAIFGSAPRQGGVVRLAGAAYDAPSPRSSIDAGLGFLTEDRKGEGLLMLQDAASNMSAPLLRAFAKGPVLDRKAEIRAAVEDIGKFRIAVRGPTAGVRTLSGGNQQKILFARWMRACRKVLILDEPTRGVDVGAKVEIYRLIRELADAGVGVLVISSEMPEIVGLCSRVIVMRDGRMTGELSGEQVEEREIMRLATRDARTAA